MITHPHILVLDMGSDLSRPLSQRVHSMNRYTIFRYWDIGMDLEQEVLSYGQNLRGIIISGSHSNIEDKDSPRLPAALLNWGVPVLGICYGMQLLGHLTDVPIIRCYKKPQNSDKSKKRDPGELGIFNFFRNLELPLEEPNPLFGNMGAFFPIWMAHRWMLQNVPDGWRLLGSTHLCPVAAIQKDHLFGVQFHPEYPGSLFGSIVLHNFLQYCGIESGHF